LNFRGKFQEIFTWTAAECCCLYRRSGMGKSFTNRKIFHKNFKEFSDAAVQKMPVCRSADAGNTLTKRGVYAIIAKISLPGGSLPSWTAAIVLTVPDDAQ
ncbi:MAG: hypothetical protein IJX93_01520, partial [Clostridia bacterium]|nr:hypothetical protein [Clostridia bacterium]